MDYEKKYKEALERAKDMLTYKKVRKEDMEYLFPELKESEDERIRNGLIKAVSGILKGNTLYGTDVTREEALAWLEKQEQEPKKVSIWKHWKNGIAGNGEGRQVYLIKTGNTYDLSSCLGFECDYIELSELDDLMLEKQDKHLKNYDEAEKEKTDFVSGQFIECRKSFNGFKEDNSYWFEYVGDDIYIGRSDNILNQKFHITPRQLYRLFSQQHSPKEDSNVNDEANAPTEYGKYVDECLNEASKHFFSNGEDKYSVADLFYAGVRCGRLEKQGEQTNKINLQKITFEDVLALECAMKTVKITKGGNKLYEMLVLLYNKIHNAYLVEKQGEQKPVDKVEPRFKVKYAGSEYNVLEVKDIAGVTFYGIEDEPNHIDYVKAENCEIISGYAIKENGSPYPTKPAVFSEKKPTAWLEKQGEQKSQGKLALEAANEEKADNQNCVKPAYKVESKFKAGDYVEEETTSCPTHQMAMKWLREEYDIIIVIEPHSYNHMEEKTSSYDFSIWYRDNYEHPLTTNYSTYEEAVEAAILYVLSEVL